MTPKTPEPDSNTGKVSLKRDVTPILLSPSIYRLSTTVRNNNRTCIREMQHQTWMDKMSNHHAVLGNRPRRWTINDACRPTDAHESVTSY